MDNKRNTEMRSVAKNALINLIATGINFTALLLVSIMTTRALGPENYGRYAFVMLVIATALLVLDLGLTSALTKFVSEYEGGENIAKANYLLLRIVQIQLAISLPVFFLIIRYGHEWSIRLGWDIDQEMILPLSMGVLLGTFGALARGYLAGRQKYHHIGLVLIGQSLFLLLGSVTLWVSGITVERMVWLNAGSMALQLLGLVAFIALVTSDEIQQSISSRAPQPTIDGSRIAGYCVGVFAMTTLDAIVWRHSGTYLLEHYSTAAQVGYYSLAFTLATMIAGTIPAALTGVIMPAFSSHFGASQHKGMHDLYYTTTRIASYVAFPLAALGIAVSESLVFVLFGREYAPAVWPLRLIIIGTTLGAVSSPGSSLFLAMDRSRTMALLATPVAIVNIVAGFILIPKFGAMGAGVASSTAQILGVAVGTTYLVYLQKFRFPFTHLLRVALAIIPPGMMAFWLVNQNPGWLGLIVAGLVFVVSYLPFLVLSGSPDMNDFSILRGMVTDLPSAVRRPILSVIDRLSAFA